jgi:hypothetical protein
MLTSERGWKGGKAGGVNIPFAGTFDRKRAAQYRRARRDGFVPRSGCAGLRPSWSLNPGRAELCTCAITTVAENLNIEKSK